MAKSKTAFVCQNCGSNFPKWMGKCSACGEWNTLIEEVVYKESKSGMRRNYTDQTVKKPKPITEVTSETGTGALVTWAIRRSPTFSLSKGGRPDTIS